MLRSGLLDHRNEGFAVTCHWFRVCSLHDIGVSLVVPGKLVIGPVAPCPAAPIRSASPRRHRRPSGRSPGAPGARQYRSRVLCCRLMSPGGYRLLALDLDGTLLRRDQIVDDRDIAAISELQAAGVTVTIATGRLRSGATDAARACAIDGVIACCDGSHVVDLTSGRNLVHHGMTPEIAALVRAAFTDHDLTSFVFDAGGIHHEHAGAPYAHYIRTWSPNLRVVEQDVVWQTEPLAAVAVGDEAGVAAAHAVLRDHAARIFSVSFPIYACPGKHAVMVRAAGATKGTALAELCRHVGCGLDEAVVVGDWINDVPMFEVAGRSFAMGTAPDVVRAKATDVLTSTAGAGGGIAEAIRRSWG
jgi:Cof subfamily protein (haloacid dehalogenase superfamily)